MSYSVRSPILIIGFNRPKHMQEVIKAIQKVNPAQLFFAVDGPRSNRMGEAEKCAAVRELVLSVGGDCKIHKLFRTENLGCRRGVADAIDWFFQNVEEGIILEDDCVPSVDFFRFCDELLSRYRYDARVMDIAGSNPLSENEPEGASYFFSKYSQIWGWATWRRAWEMRDIEMTRKWPLFRKEQKKLLSCLFDSPLERFYWTKLWQDVADEKIDTWDCQWVFSRMVSGGVSIWPAVNLVRNIGFDSEATHTLDSSSKLSNRGYQSLAFPLTHPDFLIRDKLKDERYFQALIRPEAVKILLVCMVRALFGDAAVTSIKKVVKSYKYNQETKSRCAPRPS